MALPLLVLDNLPDGEQSAGAVETADLGKDATTTSTELEADLAGDTDGLALLAAPEPSTSTTTTTAPTTTAPPTTVAPTTAPPATAPPTTTPPTTAPPTTAPPTTAPPAPPPPPPPPAGSVASIIRSVFGAHGDAAVAVARCESGLNPNAIGAGRYHGLFQIGSQHASNFQAVTGVAFTSGWSDPTANSRYALHLFNHGGWSSWPHCGAGH